MVVSKRDHWCTSAWPRDGAGWLAPPQALVTAGNARRAPCNRQDMPDPARPQPSPRCRLGRSRLQMVMGAPSTPTPSQVFLMPPHSPNQGRRHVRVTNGMDAARSACSAPSRIAPRIWARRGMGMCTCPLGHTRLSWWILSWWKRKTSDKRTRPRVGQAAGADSRAEGNHM